MQAGGTIVASAVPTFWSVGGTDALYVCAIERGWWSFLYRNLRWPARTPQASRSRSCSIHDL